MAVGYKIESVITEWGSADFVNAFFSNIAHHLEGGRWGSKYPALMNELYAGKLSADHSTAALHELREIRHGLARIAPSQVIWDIEDLSKRPPWEANIAETITDLSNYFVTSTGRDLLADFDEGLEYASEQNLAVEIVSF